MKKTKYTYKLLFSLLVVAIIFTFTACSGGSQKVDGNQASTILRVGYISAVGGTSDDPSLVGPEGWARHKGILDSELKKIGFTKVTYVSFPNGPDLNEALASGELDLGIYGDTPAIVAKAGGHKTRLINFSQVGMNVWLVGNKKGIKSIEELKGKTVATSKGSYMYRYLVGLLEKKGLKNDVTITHLLPNDAEAALARGDIAAFAAPTTHGPLLVEKGYPLLDEAKNHPDLPGSSVTVVTEEFVKNNPDFPGVWEKIRQAGLKDLKQDPDAYYQFHAEKSKSKLSVVKASYPLETYPEEPLPKQGITLLEGTKNFLYHQKLIKKGFKLDDWILEIEK